MKIRYKNRKLGKMVNAEDGGRKLQARYGDVAQNIMRRVYELEAAANLAEMAKVLDAHCHSLTGDRDGQIAVRLSGHMRLVFSPADEPLPIKEDGGLDWGAVTEIVIEEIVDYHGQRRHR